MSVENADNLDVGGKDSGSGRFIGERINVTTGEKEPVPISFIWRGKQYEITEISRSWQDHGFSPAAPRKRNWRMRRHHNVYIVKTRTGEEFEIYLDRGSGRRDWYIYKRLK